MLYGPGAYDHNYEDNRDQEIQELKQKIEELEMKQEGNFVDKNFLRSVFNNSPLNKNNDEVELKSRPNFMIKDKMADKKTAIKNENKVKNIIAKLEQIGALSSKVGDMINDLSLLREVLQASYTQNIPLNKKDLPITKSGEVNFKKLKEFLTKYLQEKQKIYQSMSDEERYDICFFNNKE